MCKNKLLFGIFFSFQNRLLQHNVTAGIILSNQSLVLQLVTRRSAGNYTCVASNAVGTTVSNVFPLRVKCKLLFVSPYGLLFYWLYFKMAFLFHASFLSAIKITKNAFKSCLQNYSIREAAKFYRRVLTHQNRMNLAFINRKMLALK